MNIVEPQITNYGLAWVVPSPRYFEGTPHSRPCLLATTCREVQDNVMLTQNPQLTPDTEPWVKRIREDAVAVSISLPGLVENTFDVESLEHLFVQT